MFASIYLPREKSDQEFIPCLAVSLGIDIVTELQQEQAG